MTEKGLSSSTKGHHFEFCVEMLKFFSPLRHKSMPTLYARKVHLKSQSVENGIYQVMLSITKVTGVSLKFHSN